MGYEFDPKFVTTGFQSFPTDAILHGGKDPAMDPAEEQDESDTGAALPRPAASTWFWRPWYAKLWWAGIALYWLPAGGPTRIAALDGFYGSGWGVIPNAIFLPITALLILGFGYFRRLLAEDEPIDINEDIGYGTRRRPGMPHPTMDEFDPRSGPRWIGNRARHRMGL